MDLSKPLQEFWDAEATRYDSSLQHRLTPALRAAWLSTLAGLLPATPARVLDVGAGTGYLAVSIAMLGHQTTALDLSTGMLSVLSRNACEHGVTIETVVGRAEEPPNGPFDAVVSRHLLWTLPEPVAALTAWRRVTPAGRLVLVEKVWSSADPVERLRKRTQEILRRLRGSADEYHAPYPAEVLRALPYGTRMTPSRWVELVTSAGWRRVRLSRLRTVEWALTAELPVIDRLVGVPPWFALVADAQ